MTLVSSHSVGLVAVALALGVLCVGCDQVSPVEEGRPPSVSNLQVVPDSVRVEPPTDRDSLAQVPIDLAAVATDPDGSVERVEFTIEPSLNPRGTANGTLAGVEDSLFGRRIALTVPRGVDEIYTVRVFAVDDDSLTSNQGIAQLRVTTTPE